MNALELAASLVASLIWPVVAVLILIVFRTQFASLLDALGMAARTRWRVRGFGVEAEAVLAFLKASFVRHRQRLSPVGLRLSCQRRRWMHSLLGKLSARSRLCSSLSVTSSGHDPIPHVPSEILDGVARLRLNHEYWEPTVAAIAGIRGASLDDALRTLLRAPGESLTPDEVRVLQQLAGSLSAAASTHLLGMGVFFLDGVLRYAFHWPAPAHALRQMVDPQNAPPLPGS